MFGAQASNKGLMCLARTVILDGGSQRLAFHEMTSRVPIPRGFGPIECVVNHTPAKNSRGERMFSLQQSRSRVEQIIGISVDFGAGPSASWAAFARSGHSTKKYRADEKLLNPSAWVTAVSSAAMSSKSGRALR